MKKLCTLLISGLIAFGFLGCPSKNELGNTSGFDLEGAPSWVLGKPEKELYAVGSSQIKNNKVDWAMKEATTKGRAELANMLQARIEQKVRILENSEGTQSVSAIRESVNTLLSGASRTDTWISKGGMLFAKVQIREIDNKILQKNLANLQKIDQEAAKALAQTVDELLK